jgi:alkylation response protein AidB-like acyl-CoA dehydrogenase
VTSGLIRTPDRRAVADSLDALCSEHASPAYVADCDERAAFPHEAFDALAGAGWASLAVPVEHGGTGAAAADLALVHATIARHSLALAQAYYSLWVLGAEVIDRVGSPEQRARWLPRIAGGQAKIAFALTEPGSGSDAAALRTHAHRDGDAYVINGSKVFITGAAVADMIVTAVRTGPAERKHDSLSLLCVDPRAQGVAVRKLRKVGLRALDLCEVFLDDVRVPHSALLGALDQGWGHLRAGLAQERLFLAAISVGAMRDVLDQVLRHALERSAFGRSIGGFQMVGQKIVRMRVALDAAEGLVRRAAELLDAGDGSATTAAAVAKLHATEAYNDAVREGVQVFGGYGFTEDYPVARHYRDAKFLEIGGGTSEIQTIVIGRAMGLPL